MAKKSKKKKAKKNSSYLSLIFSFLFIFFIIGIGYYVSKNGILLKEGSDFVEFGTKYDPKDCISYVFFGKAKDVAIETNVDDQKPGKYKTTYKYKNYIVETNVEVKDSLAPELVVKNYKTDMVEEVKAKKFIKSISDSTEVKTEITKMEKKDDNNYIVTIQATDTSGNVTTKTAKLTREKDEEPPVLSVPDLEVYETQYFDEMKDVEVSDNFDSKPEVTCNVDEVLKGPGDVEVTYTATDRSGNKTEYVRHINVLASPEMSEKIMYLTFDDGPSANTEDILDILDKYGVQATFFVTGNGQNYNDLIKRAYDAGHTIGLHTYSHSYSMIYESDEAFFDDLQQIQDMVEEITGEKSYITRFPGGSSNTVSAEYNEGIMTRLTEEIQKRGFDYFDWNVGSGDAAAQTVDAATIIENSKIYEGDHLVLLMHDSLYKTTLKDALPSIIEYYQAEGYSFKGLSDMSPMCHQKVSN